MASGLYNKALSDIFAGIIDMDTDALKVMLVDNDYVFDPDINVIDTGLNDVNDPSFHEVVATNYTGGFGGAGRKAASVTVEENDAANRIQIVLVDLTWTAIGGAANDTIGGAILVKEITNDTLSRVIAFFDLTDTPTNGGDVTLDFAASGTGNIQVG